MQKRFTPAATWPPSLKSPSSDPLLCDLNAAYDQIDEIPANPVSCSSWGSIMARALELVKSMSLARVAARIQWATYAWIAHLLATGFCSFPEHRSWRPESWKASRVDDVCCQPWSRG